MNENNKGKITVSIILFALMAVGLVCFAIFVLGNNSSESGEISDNSEIVTDISAKDEYSENWDPLITEAPKETKPEHFSPSVLVYSQFDSELTDINAELNKNTKKTYKMDLNQFAGNDEIIDSFTFDFHAADGSSNMGEVKGGFGTSVSNKCEARTDNIWYQTPEDFSVMSDGSKCSVTWELPSEIKEYITVSEGQLLFGYWWSNVDDIVLDKVTCNKRVLKYIESDGEKSSEIGKVLKPSESENTVSVPVSSLIGDGEALASLEICFEGSEPVTEIKGHFTVDTGSFMGGSYDSSDFIVKSEENAISVKWAFPDIVKRNIDPAGNITFTIERCSLPEITAKELKAQYTVTE